MKKIQQTTLKKAKAKIRRIRQNMVHSMGLTLGEIAAAGGAGLIDLNQTWWWTEEWQKGERWAQKEIDEGALMGPFTTLREFKKAVQNL